MARKTFRRHLSMPGLLEIVRQHFDTITDPVNPREYSLSDCLMCCLAMFLLKFPSLLQFDNATRKDKNPKILRNLKNLYGVKKVPSDSCLRERLDQVDVDALRVVFKKIFAKVQSGGVLKYFTVFDGYYLLSIDGTQIYSSEKVCCDRCCTRHHKDGRMTHYHQMLAGALAHPSHNKVISLAPEMINQQDGETKNDCERNAARRFIDDFRREHPHLKVIVLADGLASNGPYIKMLRAKNMCFILVAKEADHRFLFDWVNNCNDTQTITITENTPKGKYFHQFRFLNDAPLNETHFDERVNFLEYKEIPPNGKPTSWTWVTDLELNEETVMQIMRSARTRWRIENEVFQTLKKSTGYNIEHNYGHGKNSLCTVFPTLSHLAFLLDQVQELCCPRFQEAFRRNKNCKKNLWENMRNTFTNGIFNDWGSFWDMMSERPEMIVMTTISDWRTSWNGLPQPPPKTSVGNAEISP